VRNQRATAISRLENESFDVLVVGGGIVGAGVARDAALRGLHTALIEKDDFASGTSSRSSKLIHGGQRYLETGDFGLVYESCAERALLSRLAPHLVRPLPFLFPAGAPGFPSRVTLALGLWLYDAIALGRNVERHHFVSAVSARREAPRLEPREFSGAFRYFDAQADDALLVIANLRDARDLGAALAPRVAMRELRRGARGRTQGVLAEDARSGRRFPIAARSVIACLGVWTGDLEVLLGEPLPVRLRPARGSHLFLRPGALPVSAAVVMLDRDGRRCYAIPWRGGTLLGTTDTEDSTPPERVAPTAEDRDRLLEAAARSFPGAALGVAAIAGAYAGLRPLLEEPGKDPDDLSRRERIFSPAPGLVVVVGGKLTTYRRMARKALDQALRAENLSARRCATARRPLPGGEIADIGRFREEFRRLARQEAGLDAPQADRLVELEGSRAPRAVARIAARSELARPLSRELPYVFYEFLWAFGEGLAEEADDALARRMALAWECPREAEEARNLAEEAARILRAEGEV
jgi:glycerol-3-phosphate dehydrogenase